MWRRTRYTHTHAHAQLKCRRYKVKAPDCIRLIAAVFPLQYVAPLQFSFIIFFLSLFLLLIRVLDQIGQIPSVFTVMV